MASSGPRARTVSRAQVCRSSPGTIGTSARCATSTRQVRWLRTFEASSAARYPGRSRQCGIRARNGRAHSRLAQSHRDLDHDRGRCGVRRGRGAARPRIVRRDIWWIRRAGVRAWQLAGARARDVLERIGSAGSIPAPGEARTGRLAELPVLSLSVREGEFLLLVERVYSEHLLGWISETAADFERDARQSGRALCSRLTPKQAVAG